MTFRKTLAASFAVAAICCVTIPTNLAANTSAPSITYTATGTFASTPVSGADQLKLAGEPFTVTISVSASTKPSKNGSNWALYTKLKMTGEVHSGLLGPTPVTIASSAASIEQLLDPGKYDSFVMASPLKVVGISLTINATISMPSGTITKALLHPFSAVALAPGNATVVYSNGTDSTTLAIESGSLTATIPSSSASAMNVVPNPAAAYPASPAALPSKSTLWA